MKFIDMLEMAQPTSAQKEINYYYNKTDYVAIGGLVGKNAKGYLKKNFQN
jgi:hypothetical protein